MGVRGRRFNFPVPHLSAIADWVKARSILESYLRRLVDTDSGLPTPHGETHSADSVDPLDVPGLPTDITIGSVSAIGSGPAYAYENHTHGLATASIHGFVMRRVSLRI